VRPKNAEMEEQMFIKELKYRSFSFGEGAGG
jgi:hypothetical protein